MFLFNCAKIIWKELLKWLESSNCCKSLSKLAWPSYYATFQPSFSSRCSSRCVWYASLRCVPSFNVHCTLVAFDFVKRPIEWKSNVCLTILASRTCNKSIWQIHEWDDDETGWFEIMKGPAPIISIAYPKHYSYSRTHIFSAD